MSGYQNFLPRGSSPLDRLSRNPLSSNRSKIQDTSLQVGTSNRDNTNITLNTSKRSSKQTDGQFLSMNKSSFPSSSKISSGPGKTPNGLYNLYNSNPMGVRRFGGRDKQFAETAFEKKRLPSNLSQEGSESGKKKLTHPFITSSDGLSDIPNFASTNRSTADMVKDMIKLRNRNFELKQEIEKLNNFREIGEIEVRKLRKNEGSLLERIERLESDLRRQREELAKTKKETPEFDDNEIRELIEQDFGGSKGDEDWQQNVELYGKYIAVLKMDNEGLKKKVEDLEKERLKRIKDEKDKVVDLQNTQKLARIFKDFPEPGRDFTNLGRSKMNDVYKTVFNLMKNYKEELEGLFDALQKQNYDHEKEIKGILKEHRDKVEELEYRIQALKKKEDFEELYKIGVEKVKQLQVELGGQSEMIEKILDNSKNGKDAFEFKIKDLKRNENKLLGMIGDLQNEVKMKTKRLRQLEDKFGRNKDFMKMIDEERKEILEIKDKIKRGILVEVDGDQVPRRKSSRSSKGSFRVKSRGRKRNSRDRNGLKAGVSLENTPGGGLQIVPRIEALSRKSLNSRIQRRRKNSSVSKITIGASSKGSSHYEEENTEDFLERIERLVSEGKKRTVLFEFKRIMEEERRPDFMLQRKVVAVCARKYKQFRISVNDLLSIEFQKALLDHLSKTKKSRMDLLHACNIFLVLGRLFYESRTFELEEEGPEFNLDWQKIIDYISLVLKLKNSKEQEKIRALQFVFVMMKNRFKESEFIDRMDLFSYFLRLLDDGNMKIKAIVSKILLEDSKYEKELYKHFKKELDQLAKKDDQEQMEASKEEWERVNAFKLQDMAGTISNCVQRYRAKEILENLLSSLENLCMIPSCIVKLYSPELVDRLLDFCSRPLSQKITASSLNILNIFSENGYLKIKKEDILQEIAKKMKELINTDRSAIKKDYSLLLSIVDLLEYLIKNKSLKSEQISILNLLNSSLAKDNFINTKDTQRILKANIDIYEDNPSLYKKKVDSLIFGVCLSLLCKDGEQSEQLTEYAKLIYEIFKNNPKKNFILEPHVSDKLVDTNLFGSEESLNLLKEAAKIPENVKVIVRTKKFFSLCNDLILSNNKIRPKIAFLLALISDLSDKRKDIKLLAREAVLTPESVEIIRSAIDSIENDDDPDNVKTNLVFFLKLCCLDRTAEQYEVMFPKSDDIVQKLKEIMEESPSPQLKHLFTVIYKQLMNETLTSNALTNSAILEDFSQFDESRDSNPQESNSVSDDDSDDARMNDPEEQKKLEEGLRRVRKMEDRMNREKEQNMKQGEDSNQYSGRYLDSQNQSGTNFVQRTTSKAETKLNVDMQDIFSEEFDT